VAVLIEAVCVVVRREAIDQKVPGGWEGFVQMVPNASFCYDDELARVGFMQEADAFTFVGHLSALGLAPPSERGAPDVDVVNQLQGSVFSAPWLVLGRLNTEQIGGEVCIAALAGSSDAQCVAPGPWRYEGSLSQHPQVVNSAGQVHLKFLRHEKGIDVYWDCNLQAEVYSARAYGAGEAGTVLDAATLVQRDEMFRKAMSIAEAARVLKLLPPASVGRLARRDIGKAVSTLDQALQLDAGHWQSHWLRAKCLQALGQFEESLEGFSKAWLLNPSHDDTAREAGISAGEAGKPDVAVYYAHEALKLKPDDAGLRANLAMAYLYAGNLESATREASAAVQAQPADAVSRAVLVLVREVSAGRMPRPTRSGEIDHAMLKQAIAQA
jgi:tetratricopeptide (TPR) repeat protein